MKKVLSLILAIIFVISALMLNVGALEIVLEENIEMNTIVETFTGTVVTRTADGTITTRYYDFSANASSMSLGDNLNLNSYLPGGANTDAVVIPPIVDDPPEPIDNRYILSTPENRVGMLYYYIDADHNGTYESEGYVTASLQQNDLLVSCAHGLWNPLYRYTSCEGWATEIRFTPGTVSDDSDYAEVTQMSISQDFINNSQVYYENNTLYFIYDVNSDWSILQIDENYGGTYGWYGVHWCGPEHIGSPFYTIGYPFQPNNEIYNGYYGKQWKSLGDLKYADNKLIGYDIYLDFGNSGGPVLANGDVYGLANFGGTLDGEYMYGGVRINNFLIYLLLQERNASAERWN